MNSGDLSGLSTLLVSLSAAGAWFGGESGKVLLAGGLGGLTRWMASERRRLRDGLIAAAGGGVTGSYLWPIGLHLPRMIGMDAFPETPSNIALAAFLIGTMGTSAVKIFTTYVEVRAARMTKGDGNEEG